MIRHVLPLQSVLVAAWVLLTPPVPLGTELPPVEDWEVASVHETSAECEGRRDQMRDRAGAMAVGDASASALEVAAALGQLQARCVEVRRDDEGAEP